MTGELELPKFDMYEIELVVSKTHPFDVEQGDPSDRVNIKLGPNLRSLSNVSTVFNEPNEEDGQFRHVVRFQIRSSRLAFQFEFLSTSGNVEHHMSVELGSYDQKEIAPLECEEGSNRVISSFVKLLRIDQVSGSGQFSKLLAELIRAEEAEDLEMWDSAAFVGVSQRYRRKDFIKLMRDHLIALKQREDATALQSDTAPGSEAFKLLDEQEKAKMLRVHKSKQEFVMRKRARQQPAVDEAMRKIGATIECFQKRQQRWERAEITDCRVVWRDNGTRAEIRHKIQRLGDDDQPAGRPKWQNLKNLRYYEAKQSEIDSEALAQWKRNEEARRAIEEAEQAAARAKAAVVEQRTRERESRRAKMAESEKAALDARRTQARMHAKQMLRTRPVRQAIKQARRRLVEEWKVGIGTPSGDPESLPSRQAHALAKESWLNEFVEGQVAEEAAAWAKRREKMERELRKEDETIAREERWRAETEAREKAARRDELDKLRVRRRADIRQRLTIPMNKFHYAVPRAPFCEHVR